MSKGLALGLALAVVLGLMSACGTSSAVATTTCEDVGQIVLAMPPALGLQPPASAGESQRPPSPASRWPSRAAGSSRSASWATHSIGHVWGAGRDFVLTVTSFASPTKAVGVATTEDASRIAARALAHR